MLNDCGAKPMTPLPYTTLFRSPTPLPPAVSQVMAEPILYHRAPAFIEIYERVLEDRLRHHLRQDRKSTRLNSSHGYISYAVFCLKKKNNIIISHHSANQRTQRL